MARIGIDVGGTHTDGVLIVNNEIVKKSKKLTDHDNLLNSLIDVFKELTEDISCRDIDKITFSTTLTTNLILEDKLPPTGLIISGGPGLNLRYMLIDENSYIVDGAIDHRGRVIRDLNNLQLGKILEQLKGKDIATCAVATKFSVRNPIHELKIRDYIKDSFEYVSCGHQLSGSLNFPRRINTVYLNSAVYLKNKGFIESILKFLREKDISSDVFILKADGGTFDIKTSIEKPVYTILSGQSAGVIGIMSLMDIKEECSIVIDIGGTSSDFSVFYRNSPIFEPEGIKIGKFLTLVRAIYSKSIALGGDSYIHVENGEIKIGPERRDVALIFGGKYLTPTDVIFYLTNRDKKIEKELIKISKELNLSLDDVCNRILNLFSSKISETIKSIEDELNSKPVYTIKEMIEAKKIKIEKIYLMGAPAENFKKFLKNYINIPIEVVPHYDVVNAIGVAVSRSTSELNLFADTTVGRLTISEKDFIKDIGREFILDDAYHYIDSFLGKDNYEIVELLEFNVIKGFYTAGKTIRIKAQIKPGVEIYIKS